MQRGGDTEKRHLEDAARDERRLLGLLGVSFLLNQYDMALVGLALPQIQASLAIAENELGPLVGAVKLGALGGLALSVAADRAGRRVLLLATILGFAVFTTATAFAQTAAQFLWLQLAARAFIAAEETIAIVIVAEQVRAGGRGFAFGVLAIFGALGHGVAAISYGFVDALPFGWRALYAAGALPLLALAWLRSGLRETDRFARDRELHGGDAGSWVRPVRELLVVRPARLASLVVGTVAFGFGVSPALALVSKTLQDVHGWSPPDVTLLVVGAGSLTLATYPLAGHLSDRVGRRRVLVASLLVNALGVVAFYSASGPGLVACWLAMMASFMAADVLFGALGAELFGTSHRVTASGVRMLALSGGGALGLAVEGLLYGITGSHAAAVSWMALAAVPAAIAILLGVPETAACDLDQIAAWNTTQGEPR